MLNHPLRTNISLFPILQHAWYDSNYILIIYLPEITQVSQAVYAPSLAVWKSPEFLNIFEEVPNELLRKGYVLIEVCYCNLFLVFVIFVNEQCRFQKKY